MHNIITNMFSGVFKYFIYNHVMISEVYLPLWLLSAQDIILLDHKVYLKNDISAQSAYSEVIDYTLAYINHLTYSILACRCSFGIVKPGIRPYLRLGFVSNVLLFQLYTGRNIYTTFINESDCNKQIKLSHKNFVSHHF